MCSRFAFAAVVAADAPCRSAFLACLSSFLACRGVTLVARSTSRVARSNRVASRDGTAWPTQAGLRSAAPRTQRGPLQGSVVGVGAGMPVVEVEVGGKGVVVEVVVTGAMNGPKATGPCPTAIVATTVFVVVSIADTVPPPKAQLASVPQRFATYTRSPAGAKATPTGEAPTGTVAT